MAESILVVDDEEPMRIFLTKVLVQEGYNVSTVSSGEEAISRVNVDEPELILLDVHLPDMDGIEILTRVKQVNEELPVIIMTAYGGVEIAVKAIQQGATDYLSKPFSVDELCINIRMALERKKLKREITHLKKVQRQRHKDQMLSLESSKMRGMGQLVEKIAASEIKTVLIGGESGTGKQLIANAIHYGSRRADQPFMEINCAAIPEMLLESELFGYEKGAFTDARKRKIGLLEEADLGTFFFDEIGDMPLRLQGKLLKFLDTQSFRRIGGTREISVDLRIIAATNHNLEQLVKEKMFRPDLFYRLNVAMITLPPLREHPSDILPLAVWFLQDCNMTLRKEIKSISPEARKTLLNYQWPGNIRELRNVIERASILSSEDVIRPDVLPIELVDPAADITSHGLAVGRKSLMEMVEDLEKEAVQQAMRKSNGNQVRAAKILGISRDILRYRIKRYDLGQAAV